MLWKRCGGPKSSLRTGGSLLQSLTGALGGSPGSSFPCPFPDNSDLLHVINQQCSQNLVFIQFKGEIYNIFAVIYLKMTMICHQKLRKKD